MHITIDQDVFDVQSSEDGVALAQLFSTMVRDRYPHGVVTHPIYVPGGHHGPLEHWLGSRPAHEARAFRRLLESGLVHARGPRNAVTRDENHDPPRFYLPGPLQIHVKRRIQTDWTNRRLTVADAADLVQEPVHWAVENRRTDTSFVLHLAESANRAILRECLTRPTRIQTVGGGSGEIKG
ncbi:MAG TPA: hypothetical protein VNM90_22240, partial [Haliangium sp.]|nr:hypothetical protein [Haliangium sp.]